MMMPPETLSSPRPAAPDAAPASPPFWRAIVIGVALVPLNVYFGNYAYVVVQAMLWGQTSLLRGGVFVLFLLTLANLLARRVGGRAGLQPSEMLLIYSMNAIAVCISGFGMLQWLVNILPAGAYFSTPANHYDRFLHFVPSWAAPHDPIVVRDFFLGHASMYRPDILRDWAGPVGAWSLFIVGMCWVTLCLSALVRRSWTDEEKLTFPLVQLPLEMARAGAGETPFYRSRAMWAGFLLAGVLESVNALQYFYPALPSVPLKPVHWETAFTSAPYNSIGTLTTAFYPFAIGIAFLLSLEVSFSCWFFYLVTKAENVLVAALGLNSGAGAHGGQATWPFNGEQGVGAFLALGLFLLWKARGPLGDALRSAWDGAAARASYDPESPLPPRTAFWGGLAGIAVLTAFVVVLGLPLWAAIAFWAVYFLFVLVITRIIAEAGAGWAWGPTYLPVHTVLMDAAGSAAVGAKGLTAFGLLSWFESEFRDTPMPQQLMALKMGQDTRTAPRQMLWGLMLAAGVASVAGFWTYLHIYYGYGAASAQVRPFLTTVGPNDMKQIDAWLRVPKLPDTGALGGMAAGAGVVLLLAVLRQTFVGWPLHPIGYALSGTPSMEYMWCPFLVGWLIKSLVVRYGGLQTYRACLPFFLGLILGDYVVPTLWGLWGTFAHTQVYMAFPH